MFRRALQIIIYFDNWYNIVFRKSMSIFAANYLGADGTLILRFIDHHAGSRVASEIACGLYETFSKKSVFQFIIFRYFTVIYTAK